VIFGTNREETARFVPTAATIATEAAYLSAARTFLSQFALTSTVVDRVLAIYPAGDYPSPHAALVALTTDIRWSCPPRGILAEITATSPIAPRRYYFTRALDAAHAPAAHLFGAFHGLELFYVFGDLGVGGYVPTAADLALSDAIEGYWTRFAATGDPN